ncbi:MBOAT family O-acyltransferase [Zobellia russellii]|uniref:MBOAT family O-acyltransferase n=1 Tax=Zobellia russellii TaxID=248907 RepID=UPI0037DCC23E
MLFNSIPYLLFLSIIFIFYWSIFAKRLSIQNLFLLFASYFFYGLWDYRFLSLIFLSSVVDYIVGINIHKNECNPKKRKLWLWASIIFNLSLLAFFKYCNFFIQSWIDLFTIFGYSHQESWTLNIILPVGISFYTFQTMSYSLDVYYKRIVPTKNFLAFATFVAFFPQLVAGPIERASNLLGQISKKRVFSYQAGASGIKLILYGLFKKVVIADTIAPLVDDIFSNYHDYSSPILILGIILFSFQVYTDFSGYSDIAIGTAQLLGIELMSNFKFPNFSRNVAEYWQRWHISLSTWFRHYLYIPLGGSKVSKIKSVRNICIIFLVSGFWHGANWTFIFWGGFHALAYIPVFLTGRNTIYKNSVVAEKSCVPSVKEIFQICLTFTIVSFSRIFFRSSTLDQSFGYIKRIFSNFEYTEYTHPQNKNLTPILILLICFNVYEFLIRKNERSPFNFESKHLRFFIYCLVIFCFFYFYDDDVPNSFIYFQF